MQKHQLTLALLLGVLIGCATSYATQATSVTAQSGSGASGDFRECVAYTLDFDGDSEDLPGNAKPIDGWTPVGGTLTQGGERPAVVLCR